MARGRLPTPSYHRLAADLRERIRSGDLAPGQVFPSEATLMGEHGVSRVTVRRAVAQLRAEGLVVTRHGHGTFVRDDRALEPVNADRGMVIARMPTIEEREELKLAEGVPVLVWSRSGETDQVLPADRFFIEILR